MMESTGLADPPPDPLHLFTAWYEAAVRCDPIKYPAAVCLSTVDLDGFPDGRTVLLKSYDAAGFVFFTDTESVKGRSLLRFPEAALTFYWGPLERQIRIRGAVETTTDEVSDACFEMRPRGSQLTAWASRQSRSLRTRRELDRAFASTLKRFEGQDPVPRPPHWRGYRLQPRTMEFFAAKANRLHDRLLYSRDGAGSWTTSWLYP